jgi:hypothetical protein
LVLVGMVTTGAGGVEMVVMIEIVALDGAAEEAGAVVAGAGGL